MKVFIEQRLTDFVRQMDVDKTVNRNVHPMASQSVTLKKDRNTEKYITGYEVPFGTTKEAILKDKNHKLYELMVERDRIEQALGIQLEGGDENGFLAFFRYYLSKKLDANTVAKQSLVLENPKDLFTYRALIANGLVAPSKEDLNSKEFFGRDYYFSEPFKEVSNKKANALLRGKLYNKLLKFSENKAWLYCVNHKLKLPSAPGLSEDNLYTQLDEFIGKQIEKKNLEKIQAVFDTIPTELLYDFVIEQGLQYKIIITGQNGVFVFRGTPIADTAAEVTKILKSETANKLFTDIREEVEKRFGITK